MRVVALLTSIALLGCFNNPRHRTYAKIGEGVAIVAGIALLAVVNTAADCEENMITVDDDCESKSKLLSSVGLGLILAGMLGFVVTVSTEDDDAPTTTVVPKTQPTTEPAPAAPASEPPAAPAPAPEATPAPAEPTPAPTN
jgi:hypothetical protein